MMSVYRKFVKKPYDVDVRKNIEKERRPQAWKSYTAWAIE